MDQRLIFVAMMLFMLPSLAASGKNIHGLLTKCEVKIVGYWPSSFFCVFMDRDGVEVHKLANKRTTPISSHLARTSLVNKAFIIWLSGKFFLRDTVGSPERARYSTMPARVANHNAGFDSSCPLTELAI